ncbi:MAG: hypothetical protein ACI8RD_001683, partial [Bacillariaceae sp.]
AFENKLNTSNSNDIPVSGLNTIKRKEVGINPKYLHSYSRFFFLFLIRYNIRLIRMHDLNSNRFRRHRVFFFNRRDDQNKQEEQKHKFGPGTLKN